MPAPFILRRWTANVLTVDRDAYLAYVHETAGKQYPSMRGNLGYLIGAMDLPSGVTRITAESYWESTQCIREFAGEQYERAVYHPRDREFLMSLPEHVEHFVVPGAMFSAIRLAESEARGPHPDRPPTSGRSL